ncbi:MAG: hypothetical protein LUG62_02050 [Clostridiales bacterium]|nr:hypothetical protein [Clostridiales bacterium]
MKFQKTAAFLLTGVMTAGSLAVPVWADEEVTANFVTVPNDGDRPEYTASDYITLKKKYKDVDVEDIEPVEITEEDMENILLYQCEKTGVEVEDESKILSDDQAAGELSDGEFSTMEEYSADLQAELAVWDRYTQLGSDMLEIIYENLDIQEYPEDVLEYDAKILLDEESPSVSDLAYGEELAKDGLGMEMLLRCVAEREGIVLDEEEKEELTMLTACFYYIYADTVDMAETYIQYLDNGNIEDMTNLTMEGWLYQMKISYVLGEYAAENLLSTGSGT